MVGYPEVERARGCARDQASKEGPPIAVGFQARLWSIRGRDMAGLRSGCVAAFRGTGSDGGHSAMMGGVGQIGRDFRDYVAGFPGARKYRLARGLNRK